MQPTIGIITLWYGAEHAIERFASNLEHLDQPGLCSVFVIQKQTPDEIARLARRVPGAIILRPGANLGTAAGWNLGIRRLLADGATYIGLWNVDVRLETDCLRRLIQVMQADPGIGACQPLLLYSDQPATVQMFGGSFDAATGEAHHDFNGAAAGPELPAMRDAEYLDGGSMLIRVEALKAAGAFDERLFMYAEDADLCHRLRQAGYRTVAVRDARAWHYHRQERGALPTPYELFYATRNRLYLVLKLAGWRAWARLVVRLGAGLPRQGLYYWNERKPGLVWPYALGILYGFSRRMGKQGWVA